MIIMTNLPLGQLKQETKIEQGGGGNFTVEKRKLNYLFHNPNPVEVTADYILKGLKGTNRKYKVYNFVKNCKNENYSTKYEKISRKTVAKIIKRNIIRI